VSQPAGFQLTVDRIRCDGSGLCAELLPELIALDDWGYPMLTPGPVPAYLGGLADRAVEACPVLALRLGAAPAGVGAPGTRARQPVKAR